MNLTLPGWLIGEREEMDLGQDMLTNSLAYGSEQSECYIQNPQNSDGHSQISVTAACVV